ncbi:N-acetylmuramoyl-L-alanine amidase [Nocardiopsis sp. MG754419]|nr:N-acetylmuramoyl-L-alanine amidase [Nocardiopsis sp. MG754419]
MSRSDLGWGSSPADQANPRSGLVIHYDSADQNLAGKNHSACLTYWRNTRDFHTGPSRGWADIGYCVDAETEILTEHGWRNFREIARGDLVRTLDHATGRSRWQPLTAVNVFPSVPRALIAMEGPGHSSLTTDHHRWPVERGSAAGTPTREWATSGSLRPRDRITLSAPGHAPPSEPKWPDPLVELVARSCAISGPDVGTAPDGVPSPVPGEITEQAPDGVPTHAFLSSLTDPQLDLFLASVSAVAGTGTDTLTTPCAATAESLLFAAVLAGRAAVLREEGVGYRLALLGRDRIAPEGLTVTRERHDGPVWCPTTPDGTWLARRRGTVYFTGNSFMACPHGYVLEGRGLYRAQAAQPGGNTSHYSCTLATGPSDPITPEQINAVRALRQWLMEPDTSIAGTVVGHRDFIATSCPGDKAYALVRNGGFAQAPDDTEGDDMPRHRRFEKDGDQALRPGDWASLAFDRRHDGETGEFYALVGVDEKDGAYYDVSVGVVLSGVSPGAEVQIRATEYEPDGDDGWRIARNRPQDSPVHKGGQAHLTYTWKGNLAAGRRVRIRVAQFGDVEAKVVSATADVFYWPR